MGALRRQEAADLLAASQASHAAALQQVQQQLQQQVAAAAASLTKLRAQHLQQLTTVESAWGQKLEAQRAEHHKAAADAAAALRSQQEQAMQASAQAHALVEARLTQQVSALQQQAQQLQAASGQLQAERTQLQAQLEQLQAERTGLQADLTEAGRRSDAALATKDQARGLHQGCHGGGELCRRSAQGRGLEGLLGMTWGCWRGAHSAPGPSARGR